MQPRTAAPAGPASQAAGDAAEDAVVGAARLAALAWRLRDAEASAPTMRALCAAVARLEAAEAAAVPRPAAAGRGRLRQLVARALRALAEALGGPGPMPPGAPA